MSRFLIRRFILFELALFLVLGGVTFLHFYSLSIIIVLLMILLYMDYYVIEGVTTPLKDLTPNRQIKTIDTLIIGDSCSLGYLKKYFDLERSLVLLAPGRSVEASYWILQHVYSRLDGVNVCIIASRRDKEGFSPYDMLYFSRITKLELGLKEKGRELYYYLFLHPMTLLEYLCSPLCHPKEKPSTNKELNDYCDRKGLQLTYLQK